MPPSGTSQNTRIAPPPPRQQTSPPPRTNRKKRSKRSPQDRVHDFLTAASPSKRWKKTETRTQVPAVRRSQWQPPDAAPKPAPEARQPSMPARNTGSSEDARDPATHPGKTASKASRLHKPKTPSYPNFRTEPDAAQEIRSPRDNAHSRTPSRAPAAGAIGAASEVSHRHGAE